LVVQIIEKNKLEQKNKMADNIKMASKHEFSIAQSNFFANQLKLGMNVLKKIAA
jgi:hypothetical protein